jgi:hypothetical protein
MEAFRDAGPPATPTIETNGALRGCRAPIFVRVYNIAVSLYPKPIGNASPRLLTCVPE